MNSFLNQATAGDQPETQKVKVNVPAETERGEAGLKLPTSQTQGGVQKSNLAMAGSAIMGTEQSKPLNQLVKKKTDKGDGMGQTQQQLADANSK